MPTYGYRCPNGHAFETFQSMTDDPIAHCPECREQAVRLFFPTGVVFKGSGFYKTDSRKAEPSTASAPAAPDGAKAEKKSSSSEGGSGPDKPAPAPSAGGDTSSRPSKEAPSTPPKPPSST
ncbi:MAG: FmdB family zinc ribbon protein [Candidatus Dormibacteria bacterium]